MFFEEIWGCPQDQWTKHYEAVLDTIKERFYRCGKLSSYSFSDDYTKVDLIFQTHIVTMKLKKWAYLDLEKNTVGGRSFEEVSYRPIIIME